MEEEWNQALSEETLLNVGPELPKIVMVQIMSRQLSPLFLLHLF